MHTGSWWGTVGSVCSNLLALVVVWELRPGKLCSFKALSALKSVLAAYRSPGLPVVSVGAVLCSGEQECMTMASTVRALAGVFLATGRCQNALRI